MLHGIQHIDPSNFDVAEKLVTFCFCDLDWFGKLQIVMFWRFVEKRIEGL
jgi:hypothetical protein